MTRAERDEARRMAAIMTPEPETETNLIWLRGAEKRDEAWAKMGVGDRISSRGKQ